MVFKAAPDGIQRRDPDEQSAAAWPPRAQAWAGSVRSGGHC